MATVAPETNKEVTGIRNTDLVLSVGVLGVLALMIFPLPSFLVDLLLAFSLSISLVIIFVSLHVLKPSEFSTFPSVLLFVTLFRLSLNIATTRLILLHGNEGPDAAGQVVKAFGNVVIGGSYTVGFVIFIILIVINFVVITKGAGRIAEVSARFILDAMPGKQMSIDADLNSGLIDEKEARRRRSSTAQEADFYGAMDGASKFVRGEAIASILIIFVNIIGGFIIGLAQKGMTLKAAAENYTLLTIGEGLVSQIPALIISTAAGVVVSRAASESDLGTEVTKQLLFHPRALYAAAGVMGLLGLVPGFPHFALLTLSAGIGFMGSLAEQAKTKETLRLEKEAATPPPPPPQKENDIPALDLIELNIGYGLIPLVDESQGGELLKRITAIRRQLAQELGFVVPPIHLRDNLTLRPNEYIIPIKGVEVAKGELMPGYFLAMNPTGVDKGIPGIPTKEPCFGLQALWVPEQEKERAQLAGYTVVDLSSVIATHLTEVIRSHARDLLGRQETQSLLDNFKKDHPKVVEELIPNLLSLGAVVKVLGNLLRERIPIRDLRTILETLADYAPTMKDPELLTEYVRHALARTITRQYQAPDGSLPVIGIDPHLDQQIAATIQQTGQGAFITLDPLLAQKILVRIQRAAEKLSLRGYPPVILCSPAVRPHLRRLVERALPSAAVLSSNEITPSVRLQLLETVRNGEGV